MEILLIAYMAIAGVFYAGYKEGIIKDDTYKRTIMFEQQAHQIELKNLNETIARNGWEQENEVVEVPR